MTPVPQKPRMDVGAAMRDEPAGHACYQAFYDKMQPWLPGGVTPASWSSLPDTLKQAWIEAAKAARAI
jgi:hypothetical protein